MLQSTWNVTEKRQEIKQFKYNLLIPKGSTGVECKRQNRKEHLTTVSAFPIGKIKNHHPSEAKQGSEHEINGAYLKDIREQSPCHIPVIKYRNLAFQRTVPCLYEGDSPVSFLPCLISMWRWRMEDGQGAYMLNWAPGRPTRHWSLPSGLGDVKGWGQRRKDRCRPRSPSFTL